MHRSSFRQGLCAALAATLIAATAAPAFAQSYNSYSCDDLWVERNQIYKDAGYCFKTRRAISYFGNAGCEYNNERQLPLSTRQRNTIDAIVRAERYNGCSN